MERENQYSRTPHAESEQTAQNDISSKSNYHDAVEGELAEDAGASRAHSMSGRGMWVQKKSAGSNNVTTVNEGRASEAMTAAVVSKQVIVSDGTKAGAGQMTQSKFLSQLDSKIRAVADPLLAKKGTSTDECPWLYYGIQLYGYMATPQQIQNSLNTYITSTRGATTATDLISRVGAHVKTHVAEWVRSGKVTGVPDDIVKNLAKIKEQAASTKKVQKKSRGGMEGETGSNAEQIHHQLNGRGQTLDGSVRTKMETALGTDLSGVKVHNDGVANQLASEQNAKAFTVGEHVAFGSGEYQPGTMHGDALLAHELAHAMQQKSGSASIQSKEENTHGYDAYENEADDIAVNAVGGLWGGTTEWLGKLGKKTGTALRSGLQLQKCSGEPKEKADPPTKVTKPKAEAKEQLPRKIVGGSGWTGSRYEKVYNNLSRSSTTYGQVLEGYVGTNSKFNLKMSYSEQQQAGPGLTNAENLYLIDPNQRPSGDNVSQAPIANRTTTTNFNPSWDTKTEEGTNAALTLNDLGRALIIAHESIHAEISLEGLEAATSDQHAPMTYPENPFHKQLTDVLTQFVSKNGFSVSAEQIELISYWGNLNSPYEWLDFQNAVKEGKINDPVAKEILKYNVENKEDFAKIHEWKLRLNKESIEPLIYNKASDPERFMIK
jgi:hypothetical protein